MTVRRNDPPETFESKGANCSCGKPWSKICKVCNTAKCEDCLKAHKCVSPYDTGLDIFRIGKKKEGKR